MTEYRRIPRRRKTDYKSGDRIILTDLRDVETQIREMQERILRTENNIHTLKDSLDQVTVVTNWWNKNAKNLAVGAGLLIFFITYVSAKLPSITIVPPVAEEEVNQERVHSAPLKQLKEDIINELKDIDEDNMEDP